MKETAMKPHPHAETIIAWANGEQIQYCDVTTEDWVDTDSPNWKMDVKYRVKPAEPERFYPQTKMTVEELYQAGEPWDGDGFNIRMANAALRHACDNGQIVTREEFDRAVGDRTKRDLAVAQAVQEKASKCMSRERHVDRIREIMDINLLRVIAEIGKE